MLRSPSFVTFTLLGTLLLTLNALLVLVSDLSVLGVEPAKAVAQALKAQATPTPGCVRAWEVIPGANVNPYSNGLAAISIVSANDIWAVGDYMDSNTRVTYQLIIHWDGNQWSVVDSPNPIANAALRAVVAISWNDVWAAGDIGGSSYTSFFIHWDGQQWSLVPSPGFDSYILTELAAISTNDVWVVGYSRAPQQTVIGHWDGQAWGIVPSPNLGDFSGLSGIAAISVNDVWAVGGYSSSNVVMPLTLHWNGQDWSIIASPTVSVYSNLAGRDRSSG